MTSISDIISDYRVLSLAKLLHSTENLNEHAFFDAIEHIVPPLPSASTVEMLLADWKALRSSLLGKIDEMPSRYRPRVDCIVEVECKNAGCGNDISYRQKNDGTSNGAIVRSAVSHFESAGWKITASGPICSHCAKDSR